MTTTRVAGDCHDPHGLKNMCVAGAIQNFTEQLLHYKEGTSDRRCKKADDLSVLLDEQAAEPLFLIFMVSDLVADNMTEALLFLSHFMGDIHQVLVTDHT